MKKSLLTLSILILCSINISAALQDVIIGADGETVGSNAQQGRTFVFDGSTGTQNYALDDPNPQSFAYFGYSASSGDINGDGAADVIVGAPNETVGTNVKQGRAYVFDGANGALLRELTTPNPQAYADFGVSVSSGDVIVKRISFYNFYYLI